MVFEEIFSLECVVIFNLDFVVVSVVVAVLGHIRPSTTNLLMGLSVKFATNLAILLWNTDIAWILVSILVSKVLSLINQEPLWLHLLLLILGLLLDQHLGIWIQQLQITSLLMFTI